MLLTKEMKLNVSQQLLPGLPDCALLAVHFLAFSGFHFHHGELCANTPGGHVESQGPGTGRAESEALLQPLISCVTFGDLSKFKAL